VMDVGIGGIHLVQKLMDRYDVLVIVDAVDRGHPAGTVQILEVAVPDLSTWSEDERREFLADMHYATPSRALILSRALGVLPPKVYLLGCQAGDVSDLGIGLSDPVQQATGEAIERLEALFAQEVAR
ncbi:MAG TPA: hydrogenase maturation protease, partial [Chloroflexota bacterium]|nr:hydrogenase maturation protease [Chloroflexota bacterium]